MTRCERRVTRFESRVTISKYGKNPYICTNANYMSTVTKEYARFDARLSKEQKLFFEKAATLGGFRSLTDFVILTVQEKAKEIIQENEQILASEKDSRIFFDAITNSKKPSKSLKNALKAYNEFVIKKKK